MENINDKKIEVEIVETNTIKAEISIQEIKDIMFEELHEALDRYSIYYDKPSLDYSDNCDSFEVFITGLDDYADASDVVNTVEENFEDSLKNHIKEVSQEKEESEEDTKKTAAKKTCEEGENGSL